MYVKSGNKYISHTYNTVDAVSDPLLSALLSALYIYLTLTPTEQPPPNRTQLASRPVWGGEERGIISR